jgi:hypothetical protein
MNKILGLQVLAAEKQTGPVDGISSQSVVCGSAASIQCA